MGRIGLGLPRGARRRRPSGGSPAPVPGYISLNGAPLAAARAKMAAVRAGSARMVVAHVGDSTTHGYQNNGSNGTRTGTAANSYVGQLPALSPAALGVPAVSNASLGCSDESGAYMVVTYEPRLGGGNTFDDATPSLGGRLWRAAHAAGNLTFHPTGQTDTVVVYYATDAVGANGSFTVSVNGGAALATPSCNAPQGTGRQSCTVARGDNTFKLASVSAQNVYYIGFDCFDSTVKAISHLNLGWGGAKAADIAGTATQYGYLNALKVVAPDLTAVNIGINDWIAGTSAAAFKASVQAVIDGARLSGDVVLMTPFPSDASVASPAAQAAIVQAIKDLGVLNGVPVIDVNARFATYAQAVADGRANDFIKRHPNTAGYALMAASVTAFLALL